MESSCLISENLRQSIYFVSWISTSSWNKKNQQCTYVRVTRADVLVRLEQHQIDLGREEAAEGDRGGDVDAHAHTRDLNLQRRQPSARLYMLKHRKTRREARVYVYARRRARAIRTRGRAICVAQTL